MIIMEETVVADSLSQFLFTMQGIELYAIDNSENVLSSDKMISTLNLTKESTAS